jgi:hypothetical protein
MLQEVLLVTLKMAVIPFQAWLQQPSLVRKPCHPHSHHPKFLGLARGFVVSILCPQSQCNEITQKGYGTTNGFSSVWLGATAFFDLGHASELKAPADLGNGIFIHGFNAGARIFSNSWGEGQTNPFSP